MRVNIDSRQSHHCIHLVQNLSNKCAQKCLATLGVRINVMNCEVTSRQHLLLLEFEGNKKLMRSMNNKPLLLSFVVS